MLTNKLLLSKTFLILMAIESMVTLFILGSVHSESKNAIFLGFSGPRLVLIAVTAGIFLTVAGWLVWLYRSGSKTERFIDFVQVFLSTSVKRQILLVICGSIILLGGLFLLIPVERVGVDVFQRALPVVKLGLIFAIQALVFQFVWLEQKIYWEQLVQWKRQLSIAGMVLVFFVIVGFFASWSGIGARPELSGWFAPGTPLLAQQVLFAWLVGSGVLLLGAHLDRSGKLNKFDYLVAALLWLMAGLTWWFEPLQRSSYFVPDPTPPNFEYYPYSDAALYDEFSQNILIGTSRQVGLTHRPLYSLFVALLHVFAGQKFESVIFLQIFILAFAVVFIYLLVSSIGERPAGILAALLLIFRERNSIALTNIIEVSHVKLIMSDVPMMMLLLLFTYFFVKWLQDRNSGYYLGVLSGASLGLAVLVRSQAQLLIPIVLLGIVLSAPGGWRSIFRKSLVFLLGLLVVVLPWVWRNYQVSGRVVIEYQEFYTRFIASAYSSSPHDIDQLPGETTRQYDARMKSQIIEYVIRNPFEVARFYSSYFLHNEISSVAYLPMSPQFLDIYDYVKQTDFWGRHPLTLPPPRIWPMFFLSLGLIALGIGTAFTRTGWVGLMPLFFHLGYSFSVVPVRMSGWRFILPVDWVSILYFSVGFMQVTLILLALFSRRPGAELVANEKSQPEPTTHQWKRTGLVISLVAFLGLSFPLLEWSVPERYPHLSSAELVQLYVPQGFVLEDLETVDAGLLTTFLETDKGSIALHGRALYPSYYPLGEFWGDDSPYLLEASQYSRLQFDLIGPKRAFVYLPLSDAPPYFPNAADVFIVGCVTKEGVRALLVKVNDKMITSSSFDQLTCSVTG